MSSTMTRRWAEAIGPSCLPTSLRTRWLLPRATSTTPGWIGRWPRPSPGRDRLERIAGFAEGARPMSTDKGRVSEWDFFICHAGEDREEVVEPLARELAGRGYRVWYDQWELMVGDNLRRRIDDGLTRSRFGIVVLSPSFFDKGWPQWELDGLVQMETAGREAILPVWHQFTDRDVAAYSPSLAGRMAVSTKLGMRSVADRLAVAAARPGPERAEALPEDDTRRGKRGEVLEAISAFRAIVESLCA